MNTRTQKMLIALAGTLSATALLTACGEELDQLTNADLNTVASFKDLGDCNSKNKGRMVYVDSSDAIYFCSDSVWKKVSLSDVKDSDGKNGKDGSDGKDGKNGVDGTSCTVEPLKDGSLHTKSQRRTASRELKPSGLLRWRAHRVQVAPSKSMNKRTATT